MFVQFAKLEKKVDEMEKGNSFIRNLDINNMVTPSAMEEKIRFVMNYVDNA